MEPTYEELKAYLEDGHTQLDAVGEFGINRSRVQRILKAGQDERGLVERTLDAFVARMGELDEERALRVSLMRVAASTADWSRTVNTGQGRLAGTQAAERLWKMLDEMGGSSDADALIEALRAE